MLKFIHNAALFLSLIFLNACAYQYSSQLNTKDLADDEKKLGVFIVRPMYFDKVEHANYFVLSEILGLKTKKKVRLTVKNRLSLSATGPSDINVGMYHQQYHQDAFSGIQSKFINATEDEEVSIINIRNTLASLKSDYFYIVGMLPEGWYHMTYMTHTIGCYHLSYVRTYKYTYKENEISFYIKAGHINYIGDLYMADAHVTQVHFLLQTMRPLECLFFVCQKERKNSLIPIFQRLSCHLLQACM